MDLVDVLTVLVAVGALVTAIWSAVKAHVVAAIERARSAHDQADAEQRRFKLFHERGKLYLLANDSNSPAYGVRVMLKWRRSPYKVGKMHAHDKHRVPRVRGQTAKVFWHLHPGQPDDERCSIVVVRRI